MLVSGDTEASSISSAVSSASSTGSSSAASTPRHQQHSDEEVRRWQLCGRTHRHPLPRCVVQRSCAATWADRRAFCLGSARRPPLPGLLRPAGDDQAVRTLRCGPIHRLGAPAPKSALSPVFHVCRLGPRRAEAAAVCVPAGAVRRLRDGVLCQLVR
jgi:hypothetical protein